MNIQLLAIDMDGTTLNRKNALSPATRNALQRAADAGILVVPATGRQFFGLPPELEAVHGIRYYLCSNGAVVFDRQEEKILHCDLMQPSQALRALAEISRWESAVTDVYIAGKAYTTIDRYQAPLRFGVDALHIKTFLASRIPVKSLPDLIRQKQLQPEKIFSIFLNTTEHKTCWDVLCAQPDLAVTNSIPNAIEVTNVTATKGGGLQALAAHLHIPQDAVMAVGDGLNDLTMLDWAGISVAMGNADINVKRHARYETASCDEDGLAKAVERFLF